MSAHRTILLCTAFLTLSLGNGACRHTSGAGPDPGSNTATVAEASGFPTEAPAPLPARNFQLPATQRASLSNGLHLVVVENHEIPMVWVNLVFRSGSWSDPRGQEGLASVTLDLLNEGAGDLDALELSAALQRMGSTLGTGAGLDQASISASCLRRNLEPTLDLWATVLTDPTMSQDEWALLRDRRVVQIEEQWDRPSSLAFYLLDRLLYGDSYDGRMTTPASLEGITTENMLAWRERHLRPANALLLVAGDVTLEEIQPMLEARIAGWTGGRQLSTPEPEVQQPQATTLYLLHRDEAPQSVIAMSRFVARRGDADYFDFYLGNTTLGGIFTSRLNLNLREEKGWTYGCRSNMYNNHAGGQWVAQTSVDTAVTADAVTEMLGEVSGILGDRPLSDEEFAFAQSNRVQSWPSGFEYVNTLAYQTQTIWQYGLPETWLEDYLPSLRAVDRDAAAAALQAHLDPAGLTVVVVGDLEAIREPLTALGYPIVEVEWGDDGPILP
jgi:zinc protease